MINIYDKEPNLISNLDLKSKKALLKIGTLHETFADIVTYSVIDSYIFDAVIRKIDDISFYYDINVEKDKIKSSTYINLLDYFIKMIRHHFFNMRIDEFLIKDIVEPNISKFEEYLSSNIEIFDTTIPDVRRNHLNALIYRILISNFIGNIKYIPDIASLLEENNIPVKNIDDYSDKECKNIIELMSDIVFCQKGHHNNNYLFVNIETNINDRLETRHKRNRSEYKNNDDYYLKKKIEEYNKEFHQSIKKFNVRKKYLKYFK